MLQKLYRWYIPAILGIITIPILIFLLQPPAPTPTRLDFILPPDKQRNEFVDFSVNAAFKKMMIVRILTDSPENQPKIMIRGGDTAAY